MSHLLLLKGSSSSSSLEGACRCPSFTSLKFPQVALGSPLHSTLVYHRKPQLNEDHHRATSLGTFYPFRPSPFPPQGFSSLRRFHVSTFAVVDVKLGLGGRIAGCTCLPDSRWANVLEFCWMLRDGLRLKTACHVRLPAPAF